MEKIGHVIERFKKISNQIILIFAMGSWSAPYSWTGVGRYSPIYVHLLCNIIDSMEKSQGV